MLMDKNIAIYRDYSVRFINNKKRNQFWNENKNKFQVSM